MSLSSPQTEGNHAGEFVKSELPGQQSREAGTMVSGQTALVAGAILARANGGTATQSFVGTGNSVMTLDATTPVLASAVAGKYTVTYLTATTFRVEDPNGNVIGDGLHGTAFADDIKFAIVAGATPCVAGDVFTVTVATTSTAYKQPDLTVASEVAVAVLISPENVDATSAAVDIAVLARGAEVNYNHVTYPTGATTAQKAAINAQLAAVGILVRP